MASIWFCSGVAFILREIDLLELRALEWTADYFRRRGHAVEVIADPRELPDRLRAGLPDVLVTDGFTLRDVMDFFWPLDAAPSRTAVVALASIEGECGSALELTTAFPGLVAAYVVRPFRRTMTPEERERFRIYLPFSEQLIVTVGHLLMSRGLDTSDAR